jgi:hypothetical protein
MSRKKTYVRRQVALTSVLGTVFAFGLVAVAPAVVPSFGVTLNAELEADVWPAALSKRELVPVGVGVHAKFAYSDGTYPSALREVIADLDRSAVIDAEGLATCRASQIDMRDAHSARRACRKSIVGGGVVHVGIEQPGQIPRTFPGQLTLFNGVERDGVTTLLIHSDVADPVPSPLVAVVKIEKGPRGRYGWHAVARIPSIAEGTGAVLGFRVKIRRRFWRAGDMRSYLTAKCPHGRLLVNFPKFVFRNEAERAGLERMTVLKGAMSIPCRS